MKPEQLFEAIGEISEERLFMAEEDSGSDSVPGSGIVPGSDVVPGSDSAPGSGVVPGSGSAPILRRPGISRIYRWGALAACACAALIIALNFQGFSGKGSYEEAAATNDTDAPENAAAEAAEEAAGEEIAKSDTAETAAETETDNSQNGFAGNETNASTVTETALFEEGFSDTVTALRLEFSDGEETLLTAGTEEFDTVLQLLSPETRLEGAMIAENQASWADTYEDLGTLVIFETADGLRELLVTGENHFRLDGTWYELDTSYGEELVK